MFYSNNKRPTPRKVGSWRTLRHEAAKGFVMSQLTWTTKFGTSNLIQNKAICDAFPITATSSKWRQICTRAFERPCIKDTTYIKCNNAPLGRRWLLNIQRGSYCPPVVAEYHNGLNWFRKELSYFRFLSTNCGCMLFQIHPFPKSEHESTKRKCPMCNGNSSSPQKTGRNLQFRNNFDTRRLV